LSLGAATAQSQVQQHLHTQILCYSLDLPKEQLTQVKFKMNKRVHHLFFPHVTVHYSNMGGKINNHDLDHAHACASDQSVITTPEVPQLSAIMTDYKQH
jgi:hypothetical protein